MGKRLIAMTLALILFAVGFSWVSYTPGSQRDPDTYYFGFFETIVFVVMYAGPMYLLAGTPLSILLDRIISRSGEKSSLKRYFLGLGLYSLAGASVGILFIVIGGAFTGYEIFFYLLIGLVASNLYFHLSWLISKKSNFYSFNNRAI